MDKKHKRSIESFNENYEKNGQFKIKKDVSKNFQYLILEKKQSRETFDSMYDQKQQMEISGTKYTKLTNKSKVLHGKRAGKPMISKFQNPL